MVTSILIFVFLIPEGFTVKHIKFYGNHNFSDNRLKEVIHTREGKPYDEFQASMD